MQPKRTAEQAQLPGAFEGETVTRRRPMSGTAQAAGSIGCPVRYVAAAGPADAKP
jgi:hypothetical protein